MQKPRRPWATFILSLVALLAALFLEWELGPARRMAGFSLVVALPLLALGFGIDWLRLTRPPPGRAGLIIALSLTTLALPFAFVFPLSQALIVVAVLSFIVVTVGAHVRAAVLGRIIEATYVGQRGERSVFVNADACWALYCDETFSMQPGEQVAFRFRGQEHRTSDGPFRNRQQFNGRVKEIAQSKAALRQGRKRSARWITKSVALAAAAAAVELALFALFVTM